MASSFSTLCSLCASLTLAVILTQAPSGYANSEGDALTALKNSLSDPNNVLASWDPSLVNPCTWFHITCNANDQVSRLDLGRNRLSGHLVPQLGNLQNLQHLEMYGNIIGGSIPAQLGNLKSLVTLDLYDNNLSGSIPPSLGKLSSLTVLRLNNNRLTGRIPKELANLSSLRILDLSSNDLCGPIPPGFGRISSVKLGNNPLLGKPCP